MRVKYSANIFDNNVELSFVQVGNNRARRKCGKFEISENGEDTGHLCLFWDQVFNSMNSNGSKTKGNESLYK